MSTWNTRLALMRLPLSKPGARLSRTFLYMQFTWSILPHAKADPCHAVTAISLAGLAQLARQRGALWPELT